LPADFHFGWVDQDVEGEVHCADRGLQTFANGIYSSESERKPLKVRSFVQVSRAIKIASTEAAQSISPWGRYLSYFRFLRVVEAANSTSDLTMIPRQDA
jgi:hypothetical protein